MVVICDDCSCSSLIQIATIMVHWEMVNHWNMTGMIMNDHQGTQGTQVTHQRSVAKSLGVHDSIPWDFTFGEFWKLDGLWGGPRLCCAPGKFYFQRRKLCWWCPNFEEHMIAAIAVMTSSGLGLVNALLVHRRRAEYSRNILEFWVGLRINNPMASFDMFESIQETWISNHELTNHEWYPASICLRWIQRIGSSTD